MHDRIALQGHQQDKIEFASPPRHNEGNFISILRLLSKCNSDLKEHLLNGPKNARYISKTIQNEILGIAADQIREFYRRCLRKSPHFSIMADEVTSHGKESFLEVYHSDFQTKPHKHEALVDFCFLTRITGESIAENILKVLENHQINIKNCRGQASDTTSSMSSPRTGVQSHIKKHAPDTDYRLLPALVRWLSFKKTKFCDMLDKSVKFFLALHMHIRSPKNSGSKSDYNKEGLYTLFCLFAYMLFFFNIKVS